MKSTRRWTRLVHTWNWPKNCNANQKCVLKKVSSTSWSRDTLLLTNWSKQKSDTLKKEQNSSMMLILKRLLELGHQNWEECLMAVLGRWCKSNSTIKNLNSFSNELHCGRASDSINGDTKRWSQRVVGQVQYSAPKSVPTYTYWFDDCQWRGKKSPTTTTTARP